MSADTICDEYSLSLKLKEAQAAEVRYDLDEHVAAVTAEEMIGTIEFI